jgi:hypothetical protein
MIQIKCTNEMALKGNIKMFFLLLQEHFFFVTRVTLHFSKDRDFARECG